MKPLNYNKLVRPDTFIGRYLSYMSVQETALAYDFWCALWLMSCALGRNVIVDRPRAPVFMNMYIVLCAESGVTRKSTAATLAFKILRQLNTLLPEDERYEIIESKSSPEMLLRALDERSTSHGQAKLAITVSEMVTFLGKDRYTITMPGTLTDLYDCPSDRSGGGSLSRGEYNYRNVYINLLTASTPTWLVRAINPEVIEGGFTSRCFFVVSEKRKRSVPWPVISSDDEAQSSVLLTDLHGYSIRAKEVQKISISTGGLATFSRWYTTRDTHIDPFRASFESREDAHILRVAAMLCINDSSWHILNDHVRTAIRIVEDVKRCAARIFEGTGEVGRIAIGIDKVREVLLASGKTAVAKGQLYIATRKHLNRNELTSLMDIMHELEMVQKFDQIRDGPGRPATYYRGTRSLLAKEATQTLLSEMELLE